MSGFGFRSFGWAGLYLPEPDQQLQMDLKSDLSNFTLRRSSGHGRSGLLGALQTHLFVMESILKCYPDPRERLSRMSGFGGRSFGWAGLSLPQPHLRL